MWRVLSLLVVVCVVCLFSAGGQTVSETESGLILQEKAIDLTLVLENSGNSRNEKISLELLDTENKVTSQSSPSFELKSGKNSYNFLLSLKDWSKTADDDLIWYRLRYRIGGAEGIISVSELLKDDFRMRVAASEIFRAGMTYPVRVRALQPLTNIPVENVSVEAELTIELKTEADEDELKLSAKGATDKEGFALLEFKIPDNVQLDEDADLKITGIKNGLRREIEEDLDSENIRDSIFLTPDKPIYQPGQTFNVRGLYFDANQRSAADKELEFKIYDEDDTVLYRETVKTSAFGIASVSWKIPDNAKLGQYRVEVESESDLDDDSMSFKVTRYDLPNFSVAVKPDKTFYLPSDKTAEIAVRADYLFGKPVTKGKVRVVQETERQWNYKEQKYDVEEKQSFEGEIDAEGKFVARADLSRDFKDLLERDYSRYEDLNFAVYFTDLTTNKTEQKRFDIRLSKEPVHVYLLGRNNSRNPKLPVTAYVSTFYADGTPAICDVEIKGKYEKSNDEKTLTKIKTNQYGAGKFTFTAPQNENSDEDFELKISAVDEKARRGTFSEEIYFTAKDALKIQIDKTIFKPGENIKATILSTQKEAIVYVDVVKDWAVVESFFIRLKNGKGELKIPYNPKFKGDLTIAAYTDDSGDSYYYDGAKDSRGIIFPAQQNLKLAANFTNPVYKPNEEAKVDFSVTDGENNAVESALGTVVFDKAVEERARTDAEFGSYFSRFGNLLGYSKSFGNVSLKTLNDLDLSKPVSADLQIVAEAMLADQYFSPRIFRTGENPKKPESVYAGLFRKQFAPVEAALKKQFAETSEHPKDENSLREILRENGIDFDPSLDPWGKPYRVVFSTKEENDLVEFYTAGANKKPNDADDFSVSIVSFNYFLPVGRKIDEAVRDYYVRTGSFIRDYKTLRAELLRQDFDLDALEDRWQREYKIFFEVSRRNYIIRVHSNGANGFYQPNKWDGDDFDVWTSRIDYFAKTETEINEILNREVNRDKKPFPQSQDEFIKLLKTNDLDFGRIRDGYGNAPELIFRKESKYADKTVIENGKQKITPVTQEIIYFSLYSKGADEKSSYDDFPLALFSSVITEKSKDTLFSEAKIRNVASSAASGAIRGTVYDAIGAVIANAEIKAIDEADETKTFSADSDDNGEFLLANLPSGFYRIEVSAAAFQKAIYANIRVQSQNVVEMTVGLQVGSVAETVDVTSATVNVEYTSSAVSATITSQQITNLPVDAENSFALVKLQPGVNGKKEKDNPAETKENSTPRLREYFPETLLWSPELITDKNGKAELKFKLADNITKWKLYTIASTKSGKIGVAEKEMQAFQSFFVDLDPPKFLTEGDEIYLPTQVRNYTDSSQKVNVSMTQGDWFSLLSPANQAINVASGGSENAVFGFKTLSAIKDAKQRVTAIAAKDSDAIEKPVTVRPNGQEIVRTDSKLFQNSASFDVDFPAAALPKTQKAELKIYPNLMAHVTESVEGLLQRPYGCGEQTISSTYPNLMILKFVPKDSKLRPTAQKYLQKGYERLIGYQVADGGFSYWGGKDESNIALTAYAIRFLTDAKQFIAVDEDVVKRAKDWLAQQQRADGSFMKKYYYETSEDSRRTKLFTAYVARTLAMLKEKDSPVLQKSLAYLKAKNAEIDEPYALSLFTLAAIDANNAESAKETVEILKKLAIPEGGGVYWKLETNTPFYGWGTAGRIETTALAVQALLKAKEQNESVKDEKLDELISKGTLFLLKNKDRYGVWYSTQTTINVLDAFLVSLAQNPPTGNQNLQISLNGANLQNITVSADRIEPIVLNLDDKLNAASNRIEIKSSDNSSVMSQVVAAHYVDWKNADFSSQTANQSRALKLDYSCSNQNAKILEEINCNVGAERIGFQGYGMLLAEIGIPPGADVSRESLQEAMKSDWSLSRYDVLPDRIVLYMWAKAGGTKFNFKFKQRYGINAQTPASVVYDYYNEEAKATIAPLLFNVK